MFFQKEESIDEKISKADKELSNLEEMMLDTEKSCKKLMDEMGTNIDQVQAFLGNRDNFSDEEWDKIQGDRATFAKKVEREINNIDHPSRKKRAFEDLKNIRGNWQRL
jgi:hypothetical protein